MNNVYSAADMTKDTITEIFGNIDKGKLQSSNIFFSKWQEVLCSIKSYVVKKKRKKLIDHSRIIDIKNNVLLIEVDHTGWIQLFETHKSYILKGLKIKIPELDIKNINYRLKKNKDTNTQRDITREEMEHYLNKGKENHLHGEQPQSGEKEYPPELQVIFDRFRNLILTNDKQI